MRIYTPGQLQLWHPDEAVPALPENLFREWKRVTEHVDFVTGNIKDTNGFCLAWSPSPPIMTLIHHLLVYNIRTSTGSKRCSPPISDGDRPTALQLPPVFYGGTRLAHLGDLSSPSSERPRAERAVSRSPRRSGYFGRR